MDGFLLTTFYFARPIMFMETGLKLGGLNFFELVTIIFSSVLAILAFISMVSGRKIKLSAVEWLIIIFVIWCSTIAIVYPETSDMKAYIKFVLPPLSFIILKRAIMNQDQYMKCLKWLVIGFSVPIIVSAYMIFHGMGFAGAIYWTGLERYSGVYSEIHTMGHNMGFFLMLSTIFIVLRKLNKDSSAARLGLGWLVFIALLAGLALYDLYNSQVRTVYMGMLVFFFLTLFFYNKKGLILFLSLLTASIIVLAPLYSKIFFDVVGAYKGKSDVEMAGSGRPFIWDHNISLYSELPFDRQLAGVGIGNTVTDAFSGPGLSKKLTIDNVWNSHNDFLEVMMETGALGLLIILLIYLRFLSDIWKMKGRDKYVFLAFFAAVMLMNFLSNSYINRFGLAQMFYMLLVYIQLPGKTEAVSKLANKPAVLAKRVAV